jgi:hypothetical protein
MLVAHLEGVDMNLLPLLASLLEERHRLPPHNPSEAVVD